MENLEKVQIIYRQNNTCSSSDVQKIGTQIKTLNVCAKEKIITNNYFYLFCLRFFLFLSFNARNSLARGKARAGCGGGEAKVLLACGLVRKGGPWG